MYNRFLLWFSALFYIFSMFTVTVCGVGTMEIDTESPVTEYIRSGSPTQIVLYTFDLNNKVVKNWFIDHRCHELCTSENVNLLRSFSGDWNYLQNTMWNRSNKTGRFALIFRQIAYQEPLVYQKFWKGLYDCIAMQNKGPIIWPEFFQQISPVLRKWFLQNLAAHSLFATDKERQEQILADFSWLCSCGIGRGFPAKTMCDLIDALKESK